MSSIKITSFKRFLNQDKQIQKACNYLSKDRALINVLLYADKQDQNLKGLQKWILKQNCQEIRFVKLSEEKSIMPAIQNTLRQNNRNTFVICSKPLNQSIQSIIKANQSEELTDQLKRLTFLLFLPQIDKIQPQNFHLKNIGLITTQIQHIKEHLNIQIQEASFLRPSSSLSSINSEQQFTFQQQFNKAYDMIQLPKQTIKQEDRILEVVLNDNPGVGHYNIKNPPLTGLTGKFSKS